MKPTVEMYKKALEDLKVAIGCSSINDDGEITAVDISGTALVIPVAVYALVVNRMDS